MGEEKEIYNECVSDEYDNKKKPLLLGALERSLGIITSACRMVNISRETHYRWMREDKRYKDDVDMISEMVLDFAESKLHEEIKGNNITAIIFYLKSKGRHRGYVESVDKTKTEEIPIFNITIDTEFEELQDEIKRLM